MMPIRGLRALGLLLPLGVVVGCRSTPPRAPQANAAQPATPSQQAAQVPAPAPSPKPLRASNEEPQIDDQTEAAVRGSQTIDFAVSVAGKPLQSASLTVRTARGKVAASGTTDDWGEFHTSLTQGTYKVEIQHHGSRTIQTARIAPDTQEVDLKLDPAPME